MAAAAWTTIVVATLAQAGATLVGFLVAVGSRSRLTAVSFAAGLYVWLFRGVPPLVLLLLFYFGLPQLGLRLSVLQAGLLGLSLYAAAYMAEIIRTALASVEPGQIEAARSMGLSPIETMGSVILPQAVRVFLPPFGNEFTSMMRTTSLLSVISFEELLRVTTLAINETFQPLELYLRRGGVLPRHDDGVDGRAGSPRTPLPHSWRWPQRAHAGRVILNLARAQGA